MKVYVIATLDMVREEINIKKVFSTEEACRSYLKPVSEEWFVEGEDYFEMELDG
jgi:hypothetical protein